jgi:hypothetical protein
MSAVRAVALVGAVILAASLSLAAQLAAVRDAEIPLWPSYGLISGLNVLCPNSIIGETSLRVYEPFN